MAWPAFITPSSSGSPAKNSSGPLAEALSSAGQRRLRQVGVIFEASAAAAAQIYALLGDTLDRYSTLISERLTMATVIFLPLTVSSSFFGMNFGWMTDHIGSAAAFAVSASWRHSCWSG